MDALRQPAPSRTAVGIPHDDEDARNADETFAKPLTEDDDPGGRAAETMMGRLVSPTMACGSTEAEAIGPFTSTYLAMRVAYFNKLGTYAEARGLDSAKRLWRPPHPCIDPYYESTSFGYGGLLPAQGLQAAASELCRRALGTHRGDRRFQPICKDSVANEVIGRVSGLRNVGEDPIVSAYRQERFRQLPSVVGPRPLRLIKGEGVIAVVYKPTPNGETFLSSRVTHNLASFMRGCSVILANRWNAELEDVRGINQRHLQEGLDRRVPRAAYPADEAGIVETHLGYSSD